MEALIQFVQGHEAILAAFGVAVIDLVFALVPSAASNGILHWVFVALSGVKKPEA